MVEALCAFESMDNLKVLVVTGDRNRDTVVKGLENARAIVDLLPVYRTMANDVTADAAAADFREHGADAILFASGSAVESFRQQAVALALRPGALRPLAGSIGAVTTAAMRQVGLPVDFEAAESTLDGLVGALVQKLASRQT